MRYFAIIVLALAHLPRTGLAFIAVHDCTPADLAALPVLCFAESNQTSVTFHVFVRSTAGVLNGATLSLWELQETSSTSTQVTNTAVPGHPTVLTARFTVTRESFAQSRFGISTFRNHRTDYRIQFAHLLASAHHGSPPTDLLKSEVFTAFVKRSYPFTLQTKNEEDSQQAESTVPSKAAPSASSDVR